MTRTAISARLAMRTFRNMRGPYGAGVFDTGARATLAATRFTDVTWLAEVGSTNDEVAARARAGAPEGVVVVADRQSAGRGRRGRTWEAPAGSSLLVSVLSAAGGAPSGAGRLPAGGGGGLPATRGGPALKWPNDLVVDGRGKLAGILAEAVGGGVVVGLGLNVDWGDEPLPPGAMSLAGIGVGRASTGPPAGGLPGRPRGPCRQSPDALLADYRAACSTIGRQVRVELPGGESFEGRATGSTTTAGWWSTGGRWRPATSCTCAASKAASIRFPPTWCAQHADFGALARLLVYRPCHGADHGRRQRGVARGRAGGPRHDTKVATINEALRAFAVRKQAAESSMRSTGWRWTSRGPGRLRLRRRQRPLAADEDARVDPADLMAAPIYLADTSVYVLQGRHPGVRERFARLLAEGRLLVPDDRPRIPEQRRRPRRLRGAVGRPSHAAMGRRDRPRPWTGPWTSTGSWRPPASTGTSDCPT